ncbi:MAG TPA: M23 family metallopeptidase [Steroidobacteraceae bacterium]
MTQDAARVRRRRRVLLALALVLVVVFALPERQAIPVAGATPSSWNRKSFWYEPWGVSGVHKGIDIFAAKGTPVRAPTYGIVLFRGTIALGGRVVVLVGPKLRLHYFAHLDSIDVHPGVPVLRGHVLGHVGDSGNAKGKSPHLHYSIVTPVPYPWRIDSSTQGWKKMFYLDPDAWLRRAARQ